jgi:Beta-ketoacyl synthase, N-terminal domain
MSVFILNKWSAWAPTLQTDNACLLEAADRKAPGFVPKLLARRLSPLARAVFNVAAAVIGQDNAMPVIFSSAHGEICKSLEMLKTIQSGEPLSPTAFSLSVHNAIAGLFSIALENRQEITVLAPGIEGIAPAFVEALGLLQEGAPSVLVLLYDEPIADFYPVAPFNLNCALPCAVALLLSQKGEGIRMELTRSVQAGEDGEQPVQLLAFLQFILTEAPALTLGSPEHSWTWRRC